MLHQVRTKHAPRHERNPYKMGMVRAPRHMHQNTPTEEAFMPSSVLVRCVASIGGVPTHQEPKSRHGKRTKGGPPCRFNGYLQVSKNEGANGDDPIDSTREQRAKAALRAREAALRVNKVTATMVSSTAPQNERRKAAKTRPRRCRTIHPGICARSRCASQRAPSAFGDAIALVAAGGLAGVAALPPSGSAIRSLTA
jgi:hypothetical protein